MAGPFDLNLRHLRALAATVRQGSLSAAATAVSLSQPALTQGLAKLERQLGAPLFDRSSKGVTATPAGAAMAARAQAAFALLGAEARGAVRGRRGFAQPEWLMTATQLHAFLALADAGSFAGAANATGQSQPALHRSVRDLEQICGVALAERRGRGVALTAAGRRIARGIRLAAAEIAAGIVEVRGDAVDAGRITIGAMPLCRALVLPAAIATFMRGAPRALIDVVEGSWRELVDPLRDGQIDLMIGALRPDPPAGCEQSTLFVDRLIVVGRAGHPLARRGNPMIDDLAGHDWIVGRPETPLRALWEALFDGRALPPAPIECGSVMVLRGILQDSDLLTLVSPDQVALELRSGVLERIGPPVPGGTRTIGITTRAGWRPTAPQRRFVELVEQASIRTRIQETQ
jgi:DNA-binding transcriptional LysR family regulator